MDRLLTMDKEQLIARMQAEFRGTMEQVAAAVNEAPQGKVISGSEMQVRDLMAEFRRRVFEMAVQMRIDSTESSFSPAEGPQGAGEDKQGAMQPQHGERERASGTESAPLVRGRGRK